MSIFPESDQASIDSIREKYRVELLRPEGLGQYVDLAGPFQDFDKAPNADPDFFRAAIVEETDVAIVGGGFGGMLAAARICNQQYVQTWFWQRRTPN